MAFTNLALPAGAPDLLREKFKLLPNRRLRVAYVAGPGDVASTFEYWKKGNNDPRVPVITYSAMFFELVRNLDAEALLLTEPEGLPTEQDQRFRFFRTPRVRPTERVAWYVAEYKFARLVAARLRNYKPDVVLLGTDAPLFLFGMIPHGIKIILSAHNTFWPMGRRPDSIKARLKQALQGRALSRISSAVCTSYECSAQLAALIGRSEKIFVEIPQLPELPNLSSIQTSDRGPVRSVLYLGRIEVEKGVLDLLEAFEAITPYHSDLTLDFAGNGSADALLRDRIRNSRMGDRMRHLGLLSAEQVHSTLSRSDLLVCPTRSSFNEGLALVVVEAAAHGVPSITSSVVPARELMADACAVYPADDSDALRKTLERLIADREAYVALCDRVVQKRVQFSDSSQSWGAQLARALLAC